MSDQSIDNPVEAEGKPIMVGARGGLKTKDGLTSPRPSNPQQVKPDYTVQGPGYDIAFFKDKGGFRVKYKGPNAEDIIKAIKGYVDKGISIQEAIDKVHTDDY